MTGTIEADVCVAGAGSGGLSLAAGAAQLGRKVVLIERHKMGGDCLNTGCVPSKALIAAAARAHAMRTSAPFGVDAGDVRVDFARVMAHVQETIAAIEPNDSVERFEKLGVKVVKAQARFVSPHEMEAGGKRIAAKTFVIATGSSPLVPPIPGLAESGFLTNETIFDNRVLPGHLMVIGGGPIGLELAQAHRRLGAQVTVLEAKQILPKDDREAAAVVREALQREGVVIRENALVTSVSAPAAGVTVSFECEGRTETVTGSHLLVAAGRTANVQGLDLDAAGIRYSHKGIEADRGLRTSNRRVFAIGDVVAGRPQFTHAAGYQAGIVIRRALFKMPASANALIPWCTYTDPELAQAGLTEDMARALGLKYSVSRWPLHDNDRAQAERHTHGFAKVVSVKGRVAGATVVSPHAGELILPWVMAAGGRMRLSAMAGLVAPYPTLSEISKRAASAHFTPTLFSPRTRALVGFLARLG